jgi:2-keto-3-deoxy-L-rhamnonate aldolase RhmA
MNLKQRLQNDEAVHGCWLNMGSSVSAEIISGTGFDWLLIDLEHGFQTERDLLPQMQAMRHSGTVPLVRVESNQLQRIQKVLDTGAMGVMFPRLYELQQVKQAVAGLRYPPQGNRGIAKMIRASDYGKDFERYFEATRDIMGIIQIETLELLEKVEEVAVVDGVDVLFTGPADLSMALGVFGQWDHPDFIKAVTRIASAARQQGKAAGVLFMDPSQYGFYYEKGYRFLGCGSDMIFLNDGARSVAWNLKEQYLKFMSPTL